VRLSVPFYGFLYLGYTLRHLAGFSRSVDLDEPDVDELACTALAARWDLTALGFELGGSGYFGHGLPANFGLDLSARLAGSAGLPGTRARRCITKRKIRRQLRGNGLCAACRQPPESKNTTGAIQRLKAMGSIQL